MKRIQVFFLLLILGVYGPLPAATLENSAVRLDADANTGALSVTLKATGRQWKPGAASTLTAEKPLALENGKITGTLKQADGTVFGVELALGKDAEVIVHVQPIANATSKTDVLYPPAFDSRAGEEIALPCEEGVLLPVTGADEIAQHLMGNGPRGNLTIYQQMGVASGFTGVCDASAKKDGYVMLVRTPFDAAFRVVNAGTCLAPQVVWYPSKGALAYEREVALQFFAQGGPTAIATAYRADQIAQGHLVTLRDKIKADPKLDRAIGGPQIWVFADGVSLDLIHELHDAGIDRGYISLPINNIGVTPVKGETFEQEMNRVAKVVPKGWFEELDRLGYLAGVYIEYLDQSTPDAVPPALSRVYSPSFWPDAGILLADGKRMIGFGGKGMRVNLSVVAPAIAEKNKIFHTLWPATTAIFIDVFGALPPMEDYDPKHPMTRSEEIASREKILEQSAKAYNWAVATEGGMDWCTPYVFAGQGLMTLMRGMGGMGPTTPYYDGGWGNEQGRPPIMLRRLPTAPPDYAKYNLGPSYRAPLYELAWHDSVVQTWRWNDNSFKFDSYSRRKDLFSILYGTAPMWILDKPTWEAHKAEFIKSYHDVCDWDRQIGLEPLTANGSLTDDHMVQYSTFGNGKTVVVNFADKAWSGNGITVAAEGFQTFDKAPAWLPKTD